MNKKEEISIGTGLVAAVKVALSNTAHTVLHPIHTAKALIGIEQQKSIPEMIREEQQRMSEKKTRSSMRTQPPTNPPS